MEIKIFKGYWTINDVKKMSDYLFVFGDNDIKLGKGGQAIIRDEPNTIGIPTKKYPNNKSNSFYYDTEYEQNIIKIDRAINNIIKKSQNYKGIVLPEDGFGTGLSKLHINAPKTLAYINQQIEQLKQLNN